MKLLTLLNGTRYTLGVKTTEGVIDVEEASREFNESVPMKMEEVIVGGPSALIALDKLTKKAKELAKPEDSLTFGPCITNPEKILCVGLNYKLHAIETKTPFPDSPILFSKFNNALIGHKGTISLPARVKCFDYEVELVIVIGKTAKDVSKGDALSYVFGYTIGNDFSARDLQFSTSQWLLGKTCDGFAPIGPYIVTADQIVDPNDLLIESHVNGEVRQSSNTKDMIFDCATIISYISKYMTLKPGDLIFTGTPSGVILGYPESKQLWLKSGDKVSVIIEKLGVLESTLS
ncbi:MAG: fumarylacetoacetate hydrolase family protein [Desulfitobacteriaceae bacterium]